MNFCLSDLVPPLRWSDASTITLLTGQPDLPDAWWRSLPMPHVLAAIGPESLGELLTEIALERWPAAALGDVLPALHVLDPDDADEPAVAIALDRAGSWPGLLGLTSRELVDQPFIQARPVLNTLFSAVFARLASPQAAPTAAAPPSDAAAASAAVVPSPAAVPAPRVEPHGLPEPAESTPAPEAEPAPDPVTAESAPDPVTAESASTPDTVTAEEPEAVAEGPQPASAAEEPAAEAVAAEDEAEPIAEVAAEDAAEPVAEAARPEAEAEQPEPHAALAFHEGAPGRPDATRGEDGAAATDEGDLEPAAAGEVVPEGAISPEAASQENVPEEGAPEGGEPVLDADAEPVVEAGDGPEPVLHADEDPAPEPAAEAAAALAEARRSSPEGGSHPEDSAEAEGAPEDSAEAQGAPEDSAEAQGAPEESTEAEQADEEQQPEPVAAEAHEQELPQLIEAAFAGLDDKSWAVAQNRVFTDEPSAVDQLAKLFAVPPAEISATEDEFRGRLNRWLASEEAAPYRAHLDELRRTLGPAAPKEQLIGAADWHRVEIRALEVPAWQFVLATLPGQAQPLAQQPQTDLPPRPQPPMDLPAQSAFGPVPMPPPGPPQFQAFTPGAPPPGESNGGSGEQKPYQPLKDVSQTRRCFRQPDGRWWLRIDVTAEQLAGGECALPTGFASYLGLSPGESRTVRSAAGELTMTWHGRPVLESIERLLVDVGAREGGHLFLTLSDEGVLRARHLPVAAQGAETITKALRLVGYTAPGGTRDQAARVIATRIGMTGPVSLPDLLVRLRERGDRDLLALLD
ncbi:hypothetical protein ACTWPT_16420 [Nonomuraea sp. 3N208]|uniref:hypothetical protein n=1 Tax=Nonomuraea sp. 3N208 TaxID=3457421 RepID=UPI003FCE3DEE